MKELLNIEIAGVEYTLSGDGSFDLYKLDPAYDSFINTNTCGKCDLKIDIRLETGKEIPVTDGQKMIFDSGQSWSLFRGDSFYSIVLAPPGTDQPLWLARVNLELTKATVYCSDQLLLKEENDHRVTNPVAYPLDQILLIHLLGRNQGLIVHAMGLEKKGNGFIFPGKSGAGKSTLAKGVADSGKFELLSDDRIVLRKFKDDFKAFGTPWPGDAGNALNKSYPLKGIFFIEQSPYNRKVKINSEKAVEKILSVSSIAWYDSELVSEMLSFCEELILNVPVYELHCGPDIRIEDVLD